MAYAAMLSFELCADNMDFNYTRTWSGYEFEHVHMYYCQSECVIYLTTTTTAVEMGPCDRVMLRSLMASRVL